MLTAGLLRDAVEATAKSRGDTMAVHVMQRRLRVGYATAHQLVTALEDAGVLGPYLNGGRPVLVRDAATGHRLVSEAVEGGRIELDD